MVSDTTKSLSRHIAETDVSTTISLYSFEEQQRRAKALIASSLISQNFRNIPDALIILELAQRTGLSPLEVAQNLYIIHGKPSWSSQYVIAQINACGRFSPLRFEMSGDGDQRGCVAWAMCAETGDRLEGPKVTIEMAKAEGWHGKNGSKWKSLPELMLRYRAATFFGRLYAPDLLLGMKTNEEIHDIEVDPETGAVTSVKRRRISSLEKRLGLQREASDGAG